MELKAAFLAVALAFGVAGCQTAVTVSPTPVAVSAEEFVPLATISNTFEIETSRLALQRSRDPEVRRFARQMIGDHSDAARRLEIAARRAGVRPIPPTLDNRHERMLDQLALASPRRFDIEYIEMQVRAHEEAIQLHQRFAQRGDALPLVDYAQRTLPRLELHYSMITAIRADFLGVM